MLRAAAPVSRFALATAILTLVALMLRLVAGFAQHAIVPEYAAYYATVAEQLAQGHGLTVPYVWSYLTPALANGLALPRPAFEVWLPGASLVAAPLVGLFGGDAASRIAGALAGAALVPLVALLGRRTAAAAGKSGGAADAVALAAAVLAAVSLPLVTGSISSDSQALFGVTTVAGVLAVERALASGRTRDLALAGVVLGAGLLTRNETVFLLLAAMAVAAVHGRGGGVPRWARARRAGLLAAVAIVCYVPWAVRQWLVFGTPMPSQTAANAFSLSPLDPFGWLAPVPTLARYLAAGPGALLDERTAAFGHNLVDVALSPALPWSVVGLVGAALLWRNRPLRLLLATSVAVLALDTLVFPVATLFGTFLHGSAPVLALLAIGAADLGVSAASAIRQRWPGALARTLAATQAGARLGAADLAIAGIAAATAVVLLVSTATGIDAYAAWANAVPVRYAALSQGLAAAGLGNAVVIASHPAWVWRQSGHGAVVLPDEDAASILSLARAYGATAVAIDGIDGPWPDAASATACLQPVPLPADAAPLTVFRVVCTGP